MEQGKVLEKTDKSLSEKINGFGETLAGKYMTFRLAKEEYGLEILRVKEIIGYMDITKVPKTDDFMRGVINLRGKVIPVIDLRLKFQMAEVPPTEQTVIIVVQILVGKEELTMGVIVDEVLEVMDVQSKQIEPPPSFGTSNIDTDFILGVGKSEERVIFLLDINKVLTIEDSEKISSHAQNNNNESMAAMA